LKLLKELILKELSFFNLFLIQKIRNTEREFPLLKIAWKKAIHPIQVNWVVDLFRRFEKVIEIGL